ncbi:MAG: hypothetical protein H6754_03015 [Candidatus Omnitrophica bacterium]|nr:hypothetical protein [Candidatus Omnitrophota bacterium]
MGVVHKLSDDVIDFIITQKKTHSNMSCRKLSDVVHKKFHIVVSKSSVSTVLKNANLSSPVGRHSLTSDGTTSKKAVQKFKMPEHKKGQFFSSHKLQAQGASKKSVKSEIKKNIAFPADVEKTLIPKKEIIVEKNIVAAVQEMSNVKIPAEDKSVADVISKPERVVENAGMIFLMAAQQDLAGGSILGKILKDELGNRLNLNFDVLGDFVLFPEITPDDQYDLETLKAAQLSAESIQDFGMKLSIEVEILLQGVCFVRVTNKVGNVFVIGMRNRNVDCDNVQSEGELSFAEAIRIVNTEIINNVQSAVFHCPAEINNFELLVKAIDSAFGQGIQEIALLDADQLELVKYNFCPLKARIFVLGVWRWEKNLPHINEVLQAKGDFLSVQILDKTFFYRVCNANASQIAVSLSPTEKPFVILVTNGGNDKNMIKKIVADFLFSWSGLTQEAESAFSFGHDGNRQVFCSRAKQSLEKLDTYLTVSQSAQALRKILDLWSQHYFFGFRDHFVDDNQMKEQFYGLPGNVREDKRTITILFTPHFAYSRIEELKIAIYHFNARALCDKQGRRIILKVVSSAHVNPL